MYTVKLLLGIPLGYRDPKITSVCVAFILLLAFIGHGHQNNLSNSIFIWQIYLHRSRITSSSLDEEATNMASILPALKIRISN